jgi:hypothetical protein
MVATATRLRPGDVDQLRRAGGEVILPVDAAYDERRRLWNAIHDRRPALIVRPTTAQQVAAAVRFAREHELAIAVQSGGHSAIGLRGPDGCLLINLSAMRGVEVDAQRRTARANGGALLGELDIAAQAHGLVCPTGVVGHTGVAGLTLGGGVGRLQRHFGLTIDNLVAIELVTADGRLVRASETEEPDLFWGLRGAGWNFGIATAFEFRLHPFGPDLHRGALTYPADRIREIWDRFRDAAPTVPDTVSFSVGFDQAGPDAGYPDELVGRPIVIVAWNHSGDLADHDRDTAALRQAKDPLTSTIGSQNFLDVQTAHDLVLGWGQRSYIRSHNADDVRLEALEAIAELVADRPGWATFGITALGGAIARVPEEAMAYAGRASAFDLSADSSWTDAELDDANIAWCRRAMELVEPDRSMGAYPNGNSEFDAEARRRIWGDAKLTRLAALKRAWDPANVFHVNPNIAPSAG